MRRSRSRHALRALVVVGALAASVPAGPAPVAAASDVASRPADGVFVFDGRGFGHGRGLSQYGAYGAALRGLDAAQILAHYYPGAELGTTPGLQRRVLITGEDADLVATSTAGLVVRDLASGTQLAAGARSDWSRLRVRQDGGALLVEALQGAVWVPALPRTAGPVQLDGPPAVQVHTPAGLRSYRGTLRAALSGSAAKPIYVVNTVGLDDYVRGVVPAEMPASWPAEALQAQAVAARSYGMQPCPQPRSYPATGLYDVVDTTACQVYGGTSAQTPRADAAVGATADQVLRYGGAVLRAEFSASNGGRTVAAGGPFVAGDDGYDAVGADAARQPQVHRWTGVRVPAAVLEAAFGTGRLRELRVLARDGQGEWGGRVRTVRLVGEARTVEVTGAQVRSAAGLRSDWFSSGTGSAVDDKHAALGGPAGFLGVPLGPENVLPTGRFRAFEGGSVYWSASTGAFEVHGSVRDRWAATGWETGPLGYPLTDELVAADRAGRSNRFQGGSVHWSPATGAHEVHGSIAGAWAGSGEERGPLGYPRTDELVAPDRAGRFNHFQGGSVYWSPTTGAHVVRGSIGARWAAQGWERGPLGYPLSDEYAVPGGQRSDFQGGSIRWDSATGTTTVQSR